jgi:23S rRNA pseudouridine2605 synthase
MKSESLLKVLTGAGIGSRRRMAEAIKHDRVTVNGQVVEDFRHPVNLAADFVTVDGRKVDIKSEQLVTLLLHKPKGILSTARDERGGQTVADFLPEKYRHLRLYPVGRLDKDSTGLLLLTNNGELAYRLTHPKFECEKEYLIYVTEELKPDERRRLERGLKLEDGLTHPAIVRKVSSPPFNYSITIHEGRKRQVRRMLDSLGHPVVALKRIRMGNLNLGNLAEGKIRELSVQEVRSVLNPPRLKPCSARQNQAD